MSDEMDPTEIRFIWKSFIKREAQGFLEKSARPLIILWEPF
jgi:hypothetical protein